MSTKYLYEIVSRRPSQKDPKATQEFYEYYVAVSIYDAINQALKDFPPEIDTDCRLISIKETVPVLRFIEPKP
jgi:hypothetical protein